MTKNRIEAIDSLRGVAIIMVLLYHAIFWTPGLGDPPQSLFIQLFKFGYSGVDLFFVLSGFSLGYAWLKREAENLHPSISRYYLRRFWRIYPPYLIAFLVPWICSMITPIPAGLNELFLHVFLVENFSSDHFYGVNGPLWSIAVEAQFYLLFPFIALAVARGGKKWWWLPLGLVFLCLVYRTGVAFYFDGDTYRQVPKPYLQGFVLSRIPNFLFGMGMAYAVKKADPSQPAHKEKNWLLFGSGVILHLLTWLSIYYFRHASMVWREIGFAMGYSLIVFAFVRMKETRLLNNYFLKFTGKISFSMYLIHAPLILAFDYAMRMFFNSFSLEGSILILLISILLSYVASWLFYQGIERPFYNLSQAKK
jgi:peptidoglycan/LPS O-acetylase OafA/YrhL